MLEMRPIWEKCAAGLPPDPPDPVICSHERTFARG